MSVVAKTVKKKAIAFWSKKQKRLKKKLISISIFI